MCLIFFPRFFSSLFIDGFWGVYVVWFPPGHLVRLVFLLLLMSRHLPEMTGTVSKTIKWGNPMESHRNFSNWNPIEEFWYSYHTEDHDQLQSFPRCFDTAGRLCERAALLGCKGVRYQPTPWPKKCRCHLHLMNSIETLWPYYTARFIIHFCVHVPSLSYHLLYVRTDVNICHSILYIIYMTCIIYTYMHVYSSWGPQ